MKAIINFFKTHKPALAAVLITMLVLVGAAALQGCMLGDMIKHQVPDGMQSFNDGEPDVSLNDAPYLMEEYVDDVNRNIRQFNEANDRAHILFDVVNSLMTIGIEELGHSPVPGASFIAAGLLGFGGLMTRKPGTSREVAEEKRASFNKGQDVAMTMAKQFVSEETMRAMLQAIKDGNE